MCGDCEPACPAGKLSFSNEFQLAATERAGLVVSAHRPSLDPIQVSAARRQRFGRSLKLRSVSAGGCNGCELEVNALTNVNFDIGRYGIDIVASPRHADGLVLTGPITRNMAEALQLCWDAMPEPKLVIAVGACAISGSPFEGSSALDRGFLERFKPTLYVPGCPSFAIPMPTPSLSACAWPGTWGLTRMSENRKAVDRGKAPQRQKGHLDGKRRRPDQLQDGRAYLHLTVLGQEPTGLVQTRRPMATPHTARRQAKPLPGVHGAQRRMESRRNGAGH